MSRAVFWVSLVLSMTVFLFVALAGVGHILGAPELPPQNLESWTQILAMIIGGLVSFISVSAIPRDDKKKEADDERDKDPGQ